MTNADDVAEMTRDIIKYAIAEGYDEIHLVFTLKGKPEDWKEHR